MDDTDDIEHEDPAEETPVNPVPVPMIEEPAPLETVETVPAWNADASPGVGGTYELDPVTGIRRLVQPAHTAA